MLKIQHRRFRTKQKQFQLSEMISELLNCRILGMVIRSYHLLRLLLYEVCCMFFWIYHFSSGKIWIGLLDWEMFEALIAPRRTIVLQWSKLSCNHVWNVSRREPHSVRPTWTSQDATKKAEWIRTWHLRINNFVWPLLWDGRTRLVGSCGFSPILRWKWSYPKTYDAFPVEFMWKICKHSFWEVYICT